MESTDFCVFGKQLRSQQWDTFHPKSPQSLPWGSLPSWCSQVSTTWVREEEKGWKHKQRMRGKTFFLGQLTLEDLQGFALFHLSCTQALFRCSGKEGSLQLANLLPVLPKP